MYFESLFEIQKYVSIYKMLQLHHPHDAVPLKVSDGCKCRNLWPAGIMLI